MELEFQPRILDVDWKESSRNSEGMNSSGVWIVDGKS